MLSPMALCRAPARMWPWCLVAAIFDKDLCMRPFLPATVFEPTATHCSRLHSGHAPLRHPGRLGQGFLAAPPHQSQRGKLHVVHTVPFLLCSNLGTCKTTAEVDGSMRSNRSFNHDIITGQPHSLRRGTDFSATPRFYLLHNFQVTIKIILL